MNNLISIVVPAYNVALFISETLESIRKQTFTNWEAIIVDDGSTDNTVEVIKDYISSDNRFRLICQDNSGVSVARNTGILAASGMYLSFLDGDDMWQPTFLEELFNAFQVGNISMAYCGYTHLYANGLRRKFSYAYANGNILIPVVQGQTQVHIGAILVKKELIDHLGLLFTKGCLVGQDQEFIWKLVSFATVHAVERELLIYRIRAGSAITAKWNWQKHIHAFYGFKRAAEYILAQHLPHYKKEQLTHILHMRIAYKLYKIIWRMIKNGYAPEARQLINDKAHGKYLDYLDIAHLNLVDKLKAKIVFAKNEMWWNLAKML